MSQYTTGELAKLCDVTVRTVQYYDTRGILVPNKLTEGGRRLYCDEDLNRLKLICYLRDLGLSINSVADILNSDNQNDVIYTILEQQQQKLKSDISSKKEKLNNIEVLMKTLKNDAPVKSISDIVLAMRNKKSRKQVWLTVLLAGIVIDIAEITSILLWVVKGMWIPFAITMPLILITVYFLVDFAHKNIVYICPECKKTFTPNKKEFFFSNHTPKARKLTCTHCHYNGWCVEKD